MSQPYKNSANLVTCQIRGLQFLLIMLLAHFNLSAQENSEMDYIEAYIVVADTSMDYYALRTKMIILGDSLNKEIDTLGRGYESSRNLICLPDDDEDDIYAGQYLPRRYPSESLSLEYLNYYYDGGIPQSGTIALITLITGDPDLAERERTMISRFVDHPFIVFSKIYMGCMH